MRTAIRTAKYMHVIHIGIEITDYGGKSQVGKVEAKVTVGKKR